VPRPRKIAEVADILLDHLAVEKNHGVERLILRGRGHLFFQNGNGGRWFKVNLLYGSLYGSVLKDGDFVAELGGEFRRAL